MITQEDKELLLKDLCARQPYSVMINTPLFEKPTLLKGIADNMCWAVVDEDNYEWVDIDDVKPYLRPLSSMTEGERKELSKLCDFVICCRDNDDSGHLGIEILTDLYDKDDYYINNNIDIRPIDWLLSHHFDYQDLIGKGLALVAPKDMYV